MKTTTVLYDMRFETADAAWEFASEHLASVHELIFIDLRREWFEDTWMYRLTMKGEEVSA